ncbi:hypothetical protein PSTT_04924 [Puccinia striiformis]|uniref:Oxysterol binding protein n=1 Tax=Puccinia striiformis TaxID=27350 RepID=A0A2S4VQQ2_9BASI|nr:hypothetical protein PSTT_04924 [Puccinia striiformis]
MANEEQTTVPSSQRSSWSSFLKTIATFSGDLSSLTAPSFILSPTSLCEFPSYWGEPHREFAAISTGKNAEERMILTLRWFIATFKDNKIVNHGPIYSINQSIEKPLNPILGELFLGSWNSEDKHGTGELRLWTEQVSHHPPVSAYCLINAKAGVSYQGHCAQKTSFSGKSVIVKQVGHGLLRIKLPDNTIESYLITLPKLRIEGLWMASPYIELTENSHIQSSSGYHTVLEFKGKGYFTGKSHSFNAKVYKQPKVTSGVSPIYEIEGQWHGLSKFIKHTPKWWKSSSTTTSSNDEFLDQNHEKLDEISVLDLDQQGPLESRRVWKDVADGIRNGDFEAASTAKSKLENEQRAKRKEELANGTPWQMSHFDRVESDEEYARLAEMCGHSPPNEEAYYFKFEQDYIQEILAHQQQQPSSS